MFWDESFDFPTTEVFWENMHAQDLKHRKKKKKNINKQQPNTTTNKRIK